MKKPAIFFYSAFIFLLINCDKITDPLQSYNPKILFISNRGNNEDIYVMRSNGSDLLQLTMDQSMVVNPRFSPAAGKVVFEAVYRWGNIRHVFIIDSDGKNFRQLTIGDYQNYFPQFGPGGNNILFYSNQPDNLTGFDMGLWLMDIGGNHQKPVETDVIISAYPNFTPGGTKIIYLAESDKNLMFTDLYTGEKSVIVQTNNGWIKKFDISPNGNELVYIFDTSTAVEIYSTNLDGSNDRKLTNFGLEWIPKYVKYSPDGQKVLCIVNKPQSELNRILIMNRDATNQLVLLEYFVDSIALFDPTGKKIYYTNATDQNFEIYSIGINGMNKVNITNHPADDYLCDVQILY
jgi:Tol biopolymer transport system component